MRMFVYIKRQTPFLESQIFKLFQHVANFMKIFDFRDGRFITSKILFIDSFWRAQMGCPRELVHEKQVSCEAKGHERQLLGRISS